MSLTNLCKKNILCDLMPVDKRDARIFWLNIHREIDLVYSSNEISSGSILFSEPVYPGV